MAVRDVKEFYYKMQAQYLEMKADLADFEEALQAGNITEEQMKAAMEDVAALQINYDRLTYIMYLLEKPNRKSKQARHDKANAKLLREFKARRADATSVELENESALNAFRKSLKSLKGQDD